MIWGALHGFYVVFGTATEPVRRRCGRRRAARLPRVHRALQLLVTFALVTLAWVFFRSSSVEEALGIVRGMLVLPVAAGGWLAPFALFPGTRRLLLVTLLVFVVVEWLQRRRECPLDIPVTSRVVRWSAYTAVVWTTVLLAQPLGGARFIYFDF